MKTSIFKLKAESETMSRSGDSSIKPVVLPPDYTITHPPESFASSLNGQLTWHTLISQPLTPTSDLSAGIATCPPHSGHLCAHRHSQAELYYILEGSGTVTIDGVTHAVEKGSTVFIPGDAEHGVLNETEKELKWLYVFPTGNFADVVYRFSHEA